VSLARLAETPLGWLARTRTFPGVAVLCYHAVRPNDWPDGSVPFEGLHVRRATFESHCRALVSCCQPIALDDWRSAARGERTLPDRPVLLTFDDGYRTVRTEALPVLERYRVPAAVFLATGAIERREMFWYDAVAEQSGEAVVEALKHVPYDEWRYAVEQTAAPAETRVAPMTPAEVEQLSKHPLIEIGGHTHSHPILARLPREAQAAEITRCATAIRSWTGRAMRAFAYPNGRPEIDLDGTTRDVVEAAGIDHAFTSDARFAPVTGDPLMHPRFTMTAGVSAAHLLHRLARVWT
jgi:peptidoglycan/xylan/chitin deacetylase (PgdA/CDA1 family)